MDLSKDMMLSAIEDEWKKFESKVIPKEAPINQRAEMRLGFISGMLVGAKRYLQTPAPEGRKNYIDALVEESLKYTTRQAEDVYRDSIGG